MKKKASPLDFKIKSITELTSHQLSNIYGGTKNKRTQTKVTSSAICNTLNISSNCDAES